MRNIPEDRRPQCFKLLIHDYWKW